MSNKETLEKEVRALMEAFLPRWAENIKYNAEKYRDAVNEDKKTNPRFRSYNAFPVYYGILGSKQFCAFIRTLVTDNQYNYTIPEGQRGVYVLIDDLDSSIEFYLKRDLEESIKASIKNLESTLKRKYSTAIEDISIHNIYLGNDGMLNGTFTINGDYYTAQTILAWGEKNRPHYRFLLHKYKGA